MPTWLLATSAVVSLFAFLAALGMWLAVEMQHQRLLRALDPQRHGERQP